MEPLEPMIEEQPRSRFQYAVTVLLMVATILGVSVAFLQSHASLQEDRAARQAEVLAIELMGQIVQNGYESDYQAGLVYDDINLGQLSLARQFGVLAAWQAGEDDVAATYQHESGRLEAMRDALRPYSLLYSDPRYAPADEAGVPDLQRWADDSMAPVFARLEEQNAAAEARDAWGVKADAYVSVITLTAVALFLYGLALVTQARVRWLFVFVGLAFTAIGGAWSLVTLVA
jgi:hypothetical protein